MRRRFAIEAIHPYLLRVDAVAIRGADRRHSEHAVGGDGRADVVGRGGQAGRRPILLVGRHRVYGPAVEGGARPFHQAGAIQAAQALVEEREQRRFVPRVADHERHAACRIAPPQHVRGVFDHRLAVEGRPPARAGLGG